MIVVAPLLLFIVMAIAFARQSNYCGVNDTFDITAAVYQHFRWPYIRIMQWLGVNGGTEYAAWCRLHFYHGLHDKDVICRMRLWRTNINFKSVFISR